MLTVAFRRVAAPAKAAMESGFPTPRPRSHPDGLAKSASGLSITLGELGAGSGVHHTVCRPDIHRSLFENHAEPFAALRATKRAGKQRRVTLSHSSIFLFF